MKKGFYDFITFFLYLGIFVMVALIGMVIYDGSKNGKNPMIIPTEQSVENRSYASGNDYQPSKTSSGSNTYVKSTILINGVPFTTQAPYGNWKDLVYEEGCEEASITMGVYWSRGKALSQKEADENIRGLSKYEEKVYGTFMNTDVYQTADMMKSYFDFEGFKVRDDIKKQDLINSLKAGNIILVPAYGRGLKNPNYTSPGPVAHMIVIYGYDPQKKQFITHDSGTRNGKGYRYDEDVLYKAIWVYPESSIDLAPPKAGQILKKSMIEIYKS